MHYFVVADRLFGRPEGARVRYLLGAREYDPQVHGVGQGIGLVGKQRLIGTLQKPHGFLQPFVGCFQLLCSGWSRHLLGKGGNAG